MNTPHPHDGSPSRPSEAGFTLIEALIAIVILVFGLLAVTNLLLVGAHSNVAAHLGTGATAQASEVLERLKAIPFNSLSAGGDLTSDAGSISNCDDTPSQDCVVAGNFNARKGIPGLGMIRTRWQITAVDSETYFIAVSSQSTAPLGSRTRADFTTFRSCTSVTQGCP